MRTAVLPDDKQGLQKGDFAEVSVRTTGLPGRIGGLLRSVRVLYEDKNTRCWRDEIAASKGNSSKLWRTFKGVLGDAPPADSDAHTADDFATFFNDKVDAVRASTVATPRTMCHTGPRRP